MPLETKKELQNRVHQLALESFSGHQITQEAENVWRCGRPDTGMYAFRVATLPGLIVMWGDLDTFTIDAGHGYDLAWMKGAIRSPSYFLSKSRTLNKDTYFPGDFKAYLEDDLVEYAEDSAYAERLQEAQMDDFSEDALREYITETGNVDLTDVVYGYSAQAWWGYEAMALFVRLIDQLTNSSGKHADVIADTPPAVSDNQ